MTNEEGTGEAITHQGWKSEAWGPSEEPGACEVLGQWKVLCYNPGLWIQWLSFLYDTLAPFIHVIWFCHSGFYEKMFISCLPLRWVSHTPDKMHAGAGGTSRKAFQTEEGISEQAVWRW